MARRKPPQAQKAPSLHMIAKLFRRLTAGPDAGTELFEWATRTARQPGWYVDGAIPDTIDGRFAVVSTVTALCCLRLEQLGPDGDALSVALTERFAEVMESEHRELGFGDPTLGKTVLKLVASLARRVDRFRPAFGGAGDWGAAAASALPGAPDADAAKWRATELEKLTRRLESAGLAALGSGNLG